MKVKGTHREVIQKTFDVEINPFDIVKAVWDGLKPKDLDYIYDGFWYRQSGYDYHKGEELYKKDRAAEPYEIERDRICKEFRSLIGTYKERLLD